MGLREVRRLRGETGRAMFQRDLEAEAFAGIEGFPLREPAPPQVSAVAGTGPAAVEPLPVAAPGRGVPVAAGAGALMASVPPVSAAAMAGPAVGPPQPPPAASAVGLPAVSAFSHPPAFPGLAVSPPAPATKPSPPAGLLPLAGAPIAAPVPSARSEDPLPLVAAAMPETEVSRVAAGLAGAP
jgi:hypothetical protein